MIPITKTNNINIVTSDSRRFIQLSEVILSVIFVTCAGTTKNTMHAKQTNVAIKARINTTSNILPFFPSGFPSYYKSLLSAYPDTLSFISAVLISCISLLAFSLFLSFLLFFYSILLVLFYNLLFPLPCVLPIFPAIMIFLILSF